MTKGRYPLCNQTPSTHLWPGEGPCIDGGAGVRLRGRRRGGRSSVAAEEGRGDGRESGRGWRGRGRNQGAAQHLAGLIN